MQNVFACLVHEKPECIADLIENLQHFDPWSLILLYNGGRNRRLMDRLPPAQRNVLIHPRPRSLRWGKLHDFALDCMRFLPESGISFDTLTIVDSDQLLLKEGYSARLAAFLESHPEAGMLGNSPGRQTRASEIPPVRTAWKEFRLWRPLLRKYPDGEEKYVHWTFWPSTVFTAEACRRLTELFAHDRDLRAILSRSRIWATEEVILPTLAALTGLEVIESPFSYEYVKYRETYDPDTVSAAAKDPDAFWMHPVPRDLEHPLRAAIRSAVSRDQGAMRTGQHAGIIRTLPILDAVRKIEGWLEDDEADALIAAAGYVLRALPGPHHIVEIGSYCGRSTVALGLAVKASGAEAAVWAVDPHDGDVGAEGVDYRRTPPTYDRFLRNINSAGVADVVRVVREYSYAVNWDRPISLLLIDGLHDYTNVRRDFECFERHVAPGGLIAFHDYACYYPGVQQLVNEVLHAGGYESMTLARSLIVLRKKASALTAGQTDGRETLRSGEAQPAARRSPAVHVRRPAVTAIMPTADRPEWVRRSIGFFTAQDFEDVELLILDDGKEPVEALARADRRMRYIRLSGPTSLGEKRNRACEEAFGEIIVHWDDDDWSAPWRIGHQVERLDGSGRMLCGVDNPLFLDVGTGEAWQYRYPSNGKPWVYGATMAYRKAFWRAHPFPDLKKGEDTRFAWQARASEVLRLEDPSFFVGFIHGGNTGAKRRSGPRWHRIDPGTLPIFTTEAAEHAEFLW